MRALSLGVLIIAMALPRTEGPAKSDSDAPPRASDDAMPIVTQDIVKALHTTFRSYVGIKEEPPGSNNGRMVDKFNASCGFGREEHAPWCASVTHYGYGLNGLKGHGAYSPSWFSAKKRVALHDVQPGDMALVYFPSKGRYAHTIADIEFVTRSAGRVVEVTTLEGNTNAQGSREGDQFARRVRAADTLTFVRWRDTK